MEQQARTQAAEEKAKRATEDAAKKSSPSKARPPRRVVCDKDETRVVGEAFRKFANVDGLSVKRVTRNEDEIKYGAYEHLREGVARDNGGSPNEVWLFNGNDSIHDNLTNGFMTQYASQEFNKYGVGIYFAADPRLAMYFQRNTRGADMHVLKSVLLARVTLGKIDVRAAVPSSALTQPSSKIPTPGCHSNTSSENIEAIVYENHRAFPAYLIEYNAPAAADPYSLPLRSQLRKIADAENGAKPTLNNGRIIKWDV